MRLTCKNSAKPSDRSKNCQKLVNVKQINSSFIQETGEILAFNPEKTNQTLHVAFMTGRHKEQTVLLKKKINVK